MKNVALILLAACGDNLTPVCDACDSDVFQREAPCLYYEQLADRYDSGIAPYIEPLPTGWRMTITESPFDALWGEVDKIDGGSFLWAPKRYVWADGTIRYGAAGRLDITSDTCVWVAPTNVIAP